MPLGIVWALLYGAFGWGVWRFAGSGGALRVAGGSILVAALISLSWPPMHLREADLPTPWIGVWERVNIGAWLLWVATLSVVLLRRTRVSVPVSKGSRASSPIQWPSWSSTTSSPTTKSKSSA